MLVFAYHYMGYQAALSATRHLHRWQSKELKR